MSKITIGYTPYNKELRAGLDLLILYQHLQGREKDSLKRKIEMLRLKIKYDFECTNCKRQEPEIKFERDHIFPQKLGGQNTFNNLQLLCNSCNRKKYIKLIDYKYPNKFKKNFTVKYNLSKGKRLTTKYF